MNFSEQLLDAMGDVGVDLVDMAEKVRFRKSFLRRTIPAAACLALLLGAGWFAQSWLSGGPAPAAQLPVTEVQAPEQEAAVPAKMQSAGQIEKQDVYVLELPGETRRMAAVDKEGRVLAEAEDVSLIRDEMTGEILAILATTVYGADSDWESAERIIYDLQGQETDRLQAKEILCVGNLVAVNYHYGDVDLYLRDGTPVQEDLQWVIARKDCMYGVSGDGNWMLDFYGPDGSRLQRLADDAQIYQNLYVSEPETEQTLLLCESDGLTGLRDLDDNWVVEPRFRQFADSYNGYVRCKDWQDWFLVDLQTGETAYKIGKQDALVIPYANCLRWTEGTTTYVKDWYGNTLIPQAESIQVLDDDDDLTPELFLVKELSGDYVFVEPDGTERLRIADAGAVNGISSRTAAYTKTVRDAATGEWTVDFALIDLETGVGNRKFEKAYTGSSNLYLLPYDKGQTPGWIYVSYEDETGSTRTDLMDETGTVLLENLQTSSRTGMSYIGGGAFLVDGGYRFADGTWLYRFE